MPLLGVAMAQPANGGFTESRFMLPQDDPLPNNRTVSKKYMYMKGFEMILIIMTVTFFALAIRGKDGCTDADVVLAFFFGGLTVFPTLILVLLPVKSSNSVEMLLLNGVCSALLFVSGFILFASWHQLQPEVLAQEAQFAEVETIAIYKFIAALSSVITAIMYMAEAFFQALEKFRCI
ncbi:PREDICTED: uncharacterized protein LOC108570020 [Nicrophorus vespilloides]|uniref:Uncharacterized protein LOC108570020 n=1 Tax=Nicrophorus vespilloides TaxID=110193 RepID=A0ABM1NKG7_NICVS|nr:PREDICTED: uncharacterized protein LOC108570020 [Nicrophorus vespilloides]